MGLGAGWLGVNASHTFTYLSCEFATQQRVLLRKAVVYRQVWARMPHALISYEFKEMQPIDVPASS